MNKLFKKISFEYIVFPQLFLAYTLKTPQKYAFFVACLVLLPYNILLIGVILICFILVFACFFSLEILKKIFTKR